MSTKNPSRGPESLPAPSSGELEILGVLWQAVAHGAQALRLSEVRELLGARYGRAGEPSTISTQLRSLLAKGWLEVVGVSLGTAAVARARGVVRTRGAVRTAGAPVPTRSPFTAYRPKFPPGQALALSLREIAAAYPETQRHQFLLDAARALDLPAQMIAEIERLVSKGGEPGPGTKPKAPGARADQASAGGGGQ
jgi:hypothetical protein